MQASPSMDPSQDLKRLTFERVAGSDDRHLGGNVLDVGIVSWCPLIPWIKGNSWNSSSAGSSTRKCSS